MCIRDRDRRGDSITVGHLVGTDEVEVHNVYSLSLIHFSVGKLGHSQGHYRKMALAVKKVCRLAYREGLSLIHIFPLGKCFGSSGLPDLGRLCCADQFAAHHLARY